MCWFLTILPLKEKTIIRIASVALIIIWRFNLKHLIWKKTKCDQNKVLLDQSLVWYHITHYKLYLKHTETTFFISFQNCLNLLKRMEAPHYFLSLSLFFLIFLIEELHSEAEHMSRGTQLTQSSDLQGLCGDWSLQLWFFTAKETKSQRARSSSITETRSVKGRTDAAAPEPG